MVHEPRGDKLPRVPPPHRGRAGRGEVGSCVGVHAGRDGLAGEGVVGATEDLIAGRLGKLARKPMAGRVRALQFGWKVVKHVKSNAVLFARADRTLAIGGGQTSRVDAVHVAQAKAARVGNALAGSVLASDAFFPFPDGLEAAIAAGATACVQPGGSTRFSSAISATKRKSASRRC